MNQTNYNTIKNFVGESLLATTEDEFEKCKREQNKTGLYVKINFKCKDCGNIYKKTFSAIKANPHLTCQSCSIKRRGENNRLSKDIIIKKCKDAGVSVDDLYRKDGYWKIDGQCSCGRQINEVLYISILNSSKSLDKKYHCKNCEYESKRNIYKKSEKEIIEILNNKNCKLVSDYSEYKNVKTKIKIIGKCGHIYKTSLDGFYKSKGLCPKCSILDNSGDKTYNWKGGYDRENERIRKTYQSKNFIKTVLKRDFYKCQICGSNKKLNAHHLDGYNWCIEKRFDINNGITLCEECHKKFHNKYGRGNNTKEQFEDFLKNI